MADKLSNRFSKKSRTLMVIEIGDMFMGGCVGSLSPCERGLALSEVEGLEPALSEAKG